MLNMLDEYTGETPFLLSGGIAPDDAKTLLKINHPKFAGIDLNSKFELKPGLKNIEMLRRFTASLNPSKGGTF